MPDYDFHTLSPIDFENLVRDLLQHELSIRLESFKTGKDKGIDFRHSRDSGSSLIVQAKHFAGTGYKGLLSQLKVGEKPKIEQLRPERYLIATSTPLSPQNKDEIKKTLSPYIKKTEDIYGRDDLNNLLGRFPEVERQHFKLWLSSTTVLEEVLHGRILNQTRITLEDIRDKARIYVNNQSFDKALTMLKNYNYVVIAGIPGIGKTTLAKMLVLHYLRSGYDFIDISYDISEAYTVPEHNRPRVYLYDDFLGRTALAEKLRKNEDHRLNDFILSIRKAKSSKLILTTREYILSQAKETYEVLNSPLFEKPQCIVDLSQYTRPIKAQILYNHLYFSALPPEHVEAIVQQVTYLNIIDHPNYNPRIVEYMTDPMWIGNCHAAQYPALFLQNLKEPFLIWEQAFNRQLTDIARETLLVLGTFYDEIFIDDLERATRAFWSRHRPDLPGKEFQRALSELQGNFVSVRRNHGKDIISFHNPSIQDFVEKYFEKNPDLTISIGETACFFEQLQWMCGRLSTKENICQLIPTLPTMIETLLFSEPCTLINYSNGPRGPMHKGRESLKRGQRIGFLVTLLSKDGFGFIENILKDTLKQMTSQMSQLNLSTDDLFELVKRIVTLESLADLKSHFLEAAKEKLYLSAYWISDLTCITDFFELLPEMFLSSDRERISEKIRDIVRDNLDTDDPQWLYDELFQLEAIEKKFRLGLEQQIASVQDLISEAEERFPDEDDDDDRHGWSGGSQSIGNNELTEMFSTLLR